MYSENTDWTFDLSIWNNYVHRDYFSHNSGVENSDITRDTRSSEITSESAKNNDDKQSKHLINNIIHDESTTSEIKTAVLSPDSLKQRKTINTHIIEAEGSHKFSYDELLQQLKHKDQQLKQKEEQIQVLQEYAKTTVVKWNEALSQITEELNHMNSLYKLSH